MKVKAAHVALVVETVLLAALCLHAFVLTPSQSAPPVQERSSFESSNQPLPSLTLDEAPSLEVGPQNGDDVLEDLAALGCRLFNASMPEGGMSFDSFIGVSYSDFRDFAYETKLVFFSVDYSHYSTQDESGVKYQLTCVTLYEGFPIGFRFTWREVKG